MAGDRIIIRRLTPERRRAQIIDAARECIAEHGLEKATVRAIAADCGVSIGTISYHFPSLDRLIVEALRAASKRFTDEIIDQATSDTPALDRLHFLLDHGLPDRHDSLSVWRLWLDYWGRAVRDHSLATLQAERYNEVRSLVEQIVRDGMKRGEFGPVDASGVAIELVALLDGVGLQVAIGDDKMTLERARSILRSAVARMLQLG